MNGNIHANASGGHMAAAAGIKLGCQNSKTFLSFLFLAYLSQSPMCMVLLTGIFRASKYYEYVQALSVTKSVSLIGYPRSHPSFTDRQKAMYVHT